jgi:S1-C subfamily serine protease
VAIARGIIAANGNYPRPTLGADLQDITPEIAARLPRLTLKAGAIVNGVAEGGPAAAAGIAAGDVITRIGDQDLSSDRPYLNALMQYEPDQAVKVVLNRGGRIIEVEVRLGKRT